MGVYIFKSKYLQVIKIGHCIKDNAWIRVINRGFNSCICPYELKNKVNAEDIELLYWFPNLSTKDEKMLHKDLKHFNVIGEWFRLDALDELYRFIDELENPNEYLKCSKEDAKKSLCDYKFSI